MSLCETSALKLFNHSQNAVNQRGVTLLIHCNLFFCIGSPAALSTLACWCHPWSSWISLPYTRARSHTHTHQTRMDDFTVPLGFPLWSWDLPALSTDLCEQRRQTHRTSSSSVNTSFLYSQLVPVVFGSLTFRKLAVQGFFAVCSRDFYRNWWKVHLIARNLAIPINLHERIVSVFSFALRTNLFVP